MAWSPRNGEKGAQPLGVWTLQFSGAERLCFFPAGLSSLGVTALGQGRGGLCWVLRGGPTYALSPCAWHPAASGHEKCCLMLMHSIHKCVCLPCQMLGRSRGPTHGELAVGGCTRQPASLRNGTGVTLHRQLGAEEGDQG